MKKRTKNTIKNILFIAIILFIISFLLNLKIDKTDANEQPPIVEEKEVVKEKTFSISKKLIEQKVFVNENVKYEVSLEDRDENKEVLELELNSDVQKFLSIDFGKEKIKNIDVNLVSTNYILMTSFCENEESNFLNQYAFGNFFLDVNEKSYNFMALNNNGTVIKNETEKLFGESKLTILYADSKNSPNKELSSESYFIFAKAANYEVVVEYLEKEENNNLSLDKYLPVYGSIYSSFFTLTETEQKDGENEFVFDPTIYNYDELVFEGNENTLEITKSSQSYFFAFLDVDLNEPIYKVELTLDPKKVLIGQLYFLNDKNDEVVSTKSLYTDVVEDDRTIRTYTYYFTLKEIIHLSKLKVLSSNDITTCKYSIKIWKGGVLNE